MTNYLFFIVTGISLLFLFFLWSSKKSVKTGFAKDENNNQFPDAWEKRFKFLFTFENIIILVLGILIGLTTAVFGLHKALPVGQVASGTNSFTWGK